MIVESPNHWWQNWPKTHAYVAQKMFFPKSAEEIATAIQAAEGDHRPLRAVGGGWSFSDASLPGTVTTNRPNVYAVEALSEVVRYVLDANGWSAIWTPASTRPSHRSALGAAGYGER